MFVNSVFCVLNMSDPSASANFEASKKKATALASKLTGTTVRRRGKVDGLEDDGAAHLRCLATLAALRVGCCVSKPSTTGSSSSRCSHQ